MSESPLMGALRRRGLGLLLALLFGIVTGSMLAAVFAYGVSLVVR